MAILRSRQYGLAPLCGIAGALQVLILGLIISLATHSQLSSQLASAQHQRAAEQIERLALVLAPSLLQEDRITLNVTLKEWNRGSDLAALRILSPEGQALAETGPLHDRERVIHTPVTMEETALGVIQAEIDPRPVDRQSSHYLSMALMASGLCSMLAGLISYFAADRLAGWLRQLGHALQHWAIEPPLQTPSQALPIREIQELANSCEQLQEQEQQRLIMERALGRYLYHGDKPPVPTSTYLRCALLYIEITDLDVLQSRLTASELATTLAEYYRLLNQAAKLYNGKLDRYQGDGLVMTFGLSETSERDTIHCIYAAQLCLGLLHQAQQKNPQMAMVSFRLAAHWGPVLLAPIEQGDDTHYSLIGDTIYWASHLARQSDENRLLSSHMLISEIPGEFGVQWEEGPLVSDLQGNQQSNFWLQSLPETSRTLIERQIKHITSMTEKV